MSLIALFSDKGSPGATTLALTLANCWLRPIAVVECDPAGGDLALRLTDACGRPALRPDPGLLTLAAAARREPPPQLREYTQQLPGMPTPDAAVAVGVTTPEQGAGIAGLWPEIVSALQSPGTGDVLADLGRAHPGSPALAVAAAADVLVGVARADAEGILRIRDRLRYLRDALPPLPDRRDVIVLAGEDRRSAEAMASMRTVLEHAGMPAVAVGFFALDAAAVADLHHGHGARLGRSLLMRTARTVAGLVAPTSAPVSAPAPAALHRLLPIPVRAR